MFLINTATIHLEYFIGENTPRYSILSHRWRDEEVDHQTFKGPDRGQGLRGHGKIAALCDLSRKRGIEYAWCDTCCIDKTSSAELTESINSMFQWYEKAEVCFAFLDDVHFTDEDATKPSISESTWMKRGWTLQELLAPRVVEFYATDWTYIGTRHDLAHDISSATGIASNYLFDNSPELPRQKLLFQASVGERMSWAARRETTRKEDEAYCLLGLFGVNMPLLYGEGGNAFLRLQEEVLRHSFDATLLAWGPLSHDGSALLPREERDPPKLIAAAQYIFRLTNPWSSSWGEPRTVFADLSLGFLAPSAKFFSHCNELVSSRAAEINWDMTPQGLQIPLPVSGKPFLEPYKQPYVLLPCFLRRDPSLLLAIPVIEAGKGKFLRGALEGVFVSHHKWYQWPRTSIMLDTRGFSTPPSVERPDFQNIHCDVHIRSLPEGFTVTDLPSNVDKNNLNGFLKANHAWTNSGVVDLTANKRRLDLQFTISNSRQDSKLRVRLGRCTWFLRPGQTWFPTLDILSRAESDRVYSMAGITTANNELHLEETSPGFLKVQRPWPDIFETLHSGLVSVKLTEKLIAGQTVLFVDIKFGPSRLGHLRTTFRYILRHTDGYRSALRQTLVAAYPSVYRIIAGVILDIIVWMYDTLRSPLNFQLLVVATMIAPSIRALTLLHRVSACIYCGRMFRIRLSTAALQIIYACGLYSLWKIIEENVEHILTLSPMMGEFMTSWKIAPNLSHVVVFISFYYLLPVASIFVPRATPLMKRHWIMIALLETTLLFRWCREFYMATLTSCILVAFAAKCMFISTALPTFY